MAQYDFKVKPILRDHCHESPPVLTDHIFSAEGPTFHYNWTCHQRPPVLIFVANGVVFQDRFYCITLVCKCEKATKPGIFYHRLYISNSYIEANQGYGGTLDTISWVICPCWMRKSYSFRVLLTSIFISVRAWASLRRPWRWYSDISKDLNSRKDSGTSLTWEHSWKTRGIGYYSVVPTQQTTRVPVIKCFSGFANKGLQDFECILVYTGVLLMLQILADHPFCNWLFCCKIYQAVYDVIINWLKWRFGRGSVSGLSVVCQWSVPLSPCRSVCRSLADQWYPAARMTDELEQQARLVDYVGIMWVTVRWLAVNHV